MAVVGARCSSVGEIWKEIRHTMWRCARRERWEKQMKSTHMAVRGAVFTAILFIGSASCAVAQVAGTVVDQNNAPIPEVSVYGSKTTCCPSRAEETRTDAEGNFKLSDPGKIIYIRGDGFRPTSRVVTPGTTGMRIELEPDQKTKWNIEECAKSGSPRGAKFLPSRSSRFSYLVRFSLPKNAKLKKTADVDYVSYVVRFGKTHEWMELMRGVNVGSSGDPYDDWLVKSSEYSERRIGGHSWGIDSRGVFKDGTRWREANMQIGQEYVHYEKVSPEAAAYFDAIVDSACMLLPTENSRK